MTMVTPCYRAGTRLRTTSGEVAVENLAPGDQLISADGTEVPVKWIGWRHVTVAMAQERKSVLPIRIARDALDDGVPQRDLFVSPDHALYLSGVLIPASALVNGATIVQEEVDEVTYYHVECDEHTVLLAEGAPAESFLEWYDNRAFFANTLGATTLRPDLGAEAHPEEGLFAPRVLSGSVVKAVRRRLRLRATALGFGGKVHPKSTGILTSILRRIA